MYRSHVLVCGGTGCTSSGSHKIMEKLKEELAKQGLTDEVAVVQTGCHGLCALGPIMIVYPDAAFYSMVKEEDIPEIVSEHLLKGRVVKRLLYQETVTPAGVKALIDTDFYKKQHRIALRNCGIINPESIEEYIGTGGYEALGKVLTEMTPDDVIQTLMDSGLRGRGGGGFPCGRKWKQVAAHKEEPVRYVVCNGDEGDPGAFMDGSVMEGDPYRLIEGMTIAAYAVGSSEGYIYVRAEYPLSVARLRHAMKQAEEKGLLGDNILGTGFSFHMHINRGAGAFVCGEETALQLAGTVRLICEHYVNRCGFDGVNVLRASGKSAQQSVPHLHFHILPRREGDGVNAWPRLGKDGHNLEEVARRLRLQPSEDTPSTPPKEE